jgi:uncharacterized membrane protein SpoIIM required for sporulation
VTKNHSPFSFLRPGIVLGSVMQTGDPGPGVLLLVVPHAIRVIKTFLMVAVYAIGIGAGIGRNPKMREI